MSKKHFIAVAAAMKAARISRETAETLAATFKQVNPAFDRVRFLRACGIEE